jgi:hypothetical protein
MKRLLLAAVLFAVPAFAEGKTADKPADKNAPAKDAAPAATGATAQMDMSKMGPWTRKPTNEGQVKKELQEWFKKDSETMAKADFNAMVESMAFPLYMLTDDSKGAVYGKAYTREDYVAMMKPMFENSPKDSKITHKPNITVLSDNLAVVIDEFTMTMGKEKMSGKNASVMAKIDGVWKAKTAVEAGWGEMAKQDQVQPQKATDAKPASPANSPTPANTTAPKK